MTGRTPEGDANGYVGQLIDPDWSPEEKPAEPIAPPRLDGQPCFPEPGIYFGMPEDEYHAIPACSTSGLKRLSASSMDYWASSHLNPDYEEIVRDFLNHGKAVHCLVLEGEGEYTARYAVDLDPSEHEDALVSTEEIKAAIGRFIQMAPVQPKGTTKQELLDQLVELGEKHGVAVEREGTVPQLRERIRAFGEEQPVTPVSRVTDTLPDGTEFNRPAVKSDWIAQLLELDPDARVWDDMLAKHRAAHEGRTMIAAKDERRIRIAAKMVLGHPEIGKAFAGGHCEVSIFWHCRKTGAPMKARIDYLKMLAAIDLKTFTNKQGMPVDRAINFAIANYRYNLQHVIYDEAMEEAKRMLRERGEDVVRQPVETFDAGVVQWCLQWSKQNDAPAFIFVFQQSGIAPVTRGKVMPRGTVFSVTRSRAEMLKRKWVECARTFGTDPWLDMAPLEEIDDEAIPLFATELGKVDA